MTNQHDLDLTGDLRLAETMPTMARLRAGGCWDAPSAAAWAAKAIASMSPASQ
jgi:hypothetical protein